MQQPMAVDLRFILAVTKINADLERVGDQAVNIAERVMDMVELPAVRLARGHCPHGERRSALWFVARWNLLSKVRPNSRRPFSRWTTSSTACATMLHPAGQDDERAAGGYRARPSTRCWSRATSSASPITRRTSPKTSFSGCGVPTSPQRSSGGIGPADSVRPTSRVRAVQGGSQARFPALARAMLPTPALLFRSIQPV